MEWSTVVMILGAVSGVVSIVLMAVAGVYAARGDFVRATFYVAVAIYAHN